MRNVSTKTSCWTKGNDMFLYSAVSSPRDCSKHFTLHPLADLFIPKPSRLLHEDYLFRHPPLSVAMYSVIQLSELWQRGMNEIASFETAARRFEPRFSQLRAQRSTAPHEVQIIWSTSVHCVGYMPEVVSNITAGSRG